MSNRSALGSAGSAVGWLVQTIGLLVLEVVLAMIVYSYLNLFHLSFFGYLVRLAKSVLDALASLLLAVFRSSADTAYATVFGELGPKSMLLLLIGLVVSAIVRGLVGLLSGDRV